MREKGDEGYFSDGALVEKLKQGHSSLAENAMMVFSDGGKGTKKTSWKKLTK